MDQEELNGLVPVWSRVISPFEKVLLSKRMGDAFGSLGADFVSMVDGKKTLFVLKESLSTTGERVFEMAEWLQRDGYLQIKTVFDIQEQGQKGSS